MARKDFFEDKIAIITGGASGMGEAVAEILCRRGAKVVIADVNAAQAEEVASKISGRYPVRARGLDVRDADAFSKLVEDTAREHGRLDYLFNNAGVGTVGLAQDLKLPDWKRVVDIDLYGVIHGVHAAYPLMARQGFGHIVNTASIMGLTPSPLSVPYAAAKHGVVGLSASLRAEGAATGVKVSVVCPGFIDTAMKNSIEYLGVNKERALKANPFKMHPVGEAAREIVAGVEKNLAYIVLTPQAKWMWLLHRASPQAYGLVTELMIRFGGNSVK